MKKKPSRMSDSGASETSESSPRWADDVDILSGSPSDKENAMEKDASTTASHMNKGTRTPHRT